MGCSSVMLNSKKRFRLPSAGIGRPNFCYISLSLRPMRGNKSAETEKLNKYVDNIHSSKVLSHLLMAFFVEPALETSGVTTGWYSCRVVGVGTIVHDDFLPQKRLERSQVFLIEKKWLLISLTPLHRWLVNSWTNPRSFGPANRDLLTWVSGKKKE